MLIYKTAQILTDRARTIPELETRPTDPGLLCRVDHHGRKTDRQLWEVGSPEWKGIENNHRRVYKDADVLGTTQWRETGGTGEHFWISQEPSTPCWD